MPQSGETSASENENAPESATDPIAESSSQPEPASETRTETRAPAATASSYRDIIAERLARKRAENPSPQPMAFTSDVERKPAPAVASNESEAAPSENGIPAEIEATTAQQEISSAEPIAAEKSQGQSSSRERARLRQQERAALRRQGPRREMSSEEPSSDEKPIAESQAKEETPNDVIADRITRKEGGRGEGRGDRRQREPRQEREPREHREPREERQPRQQREQREPRERTERQFESQPKRAMPEGLTLRDPKAVEPKREDRPIRTQAAPKVEQGTVPAGKNAEAARTMAMKLGISVVIPLFNEQDSLRELTALLKQQLLRLAGPKYEILFVNDGSTDRSGEILHDILATSSRVSVLSFRRNLGKSAALAAGFAEAQYGIVITMDADLQDDPQEFVNLIGKLAEGYDLVSGWKKTRHDPMSKTGPSKFFNRVTSMFSGIKLHDFNCGLKAYRKQVTDSLQVYGELHRYLPALAYWQGFRVTEIPVTHHPRKFGKSKFGSSRFFKGFLDLLSIVFTNRYGKRPLHLFGTLGTLMAIAGFIIDIWLTVEWALGLTSLSNRPLLLLGLLLILVGALLISTGLLGELIVKNVAAKQLPSYSKEKGHASAEARERRANRAGGGRPFRGSKR